MAIKSDNTRKNNRNFMLYSSVKLVHLLAVFVYGGFLFTDNLILLRMQKSLSKEKYKEVRSYFASFTRALVPKALIVVFITGLYLFHESFGSISEDGLSNFQILLLIKAFLGSWLALRGVLQVFFGIQPLVFKSHRFPFILVVIIIILSQIM